MRRWVLAAAADATAEDFHGGEADSRAGAAADAGSAAADLQSDLMATSQVRLGAGMQSAVKTGGLTH